jgi:acyl-CoA synthetase (NDP forming)
MRRPSREELAAFFRPRTIALVGASDRSAWSQQIFRRFGMFGHEGKLFAVNRNGQPAHGLEGFTRCADIPEKVDMAYIYVPAAAVADALREAGAAGIRNAVVLSSGFSEAGEEGVRLERELLAAAEEAGILMMGPNSLGFANIAHRCVCTSLPTRLPVLRGKLAIVSQSGALANEFGKYAHVHRLGLSFMGATGNEAQVGVADVLDYLVDDPETAAIALYVEGISDPERLAEAAERARRAAKPIAILKLGRSEVSGAVAQAHTGSLVGDDKVFDAMCRRFGLSRVESIQELIATADFLGRVGPINPPRIGVASISGGACGMYADLAATYGLDVPPFAEATRAAAAEVLPGFASTLNPLDVTGQAVSDPTLWARVLPILHCDPGMGLIVTATAVPNIPAELTALRSGFEAIVEGYRAAGKPPVICGYAPQDKSELQEEFFKEIGIDIALPDLEIGVRALAHLQRWSVAVQADPPRAAPQSGTDVRPTSERETLEHLAAHGAPVVPMTLATTPEAATAAAQRLGGPCVLKIASPDIAHKTEAGGVRLNVTGEAAAQVFGEIMASAKAYAPGARIEGVLVGPMRPAGIELIVGVSRDPEWGPTLMVGLGGVFTEVLRDSQVRLLPVRPAEVREMLNSLAGVRLLQGFRGSPAADLDQLAKAIVAIADAALTLGPELAALEVNPLWVRGDQVECLDGLTIYSV